MEQPMNEARKNILKQMDVTEETISFLSQIEIPFLKEWAFLCAAEGMPKETLENLCEEVKGNKNEASGIFLRERDHLLRMHYENNKDLLKKFTELQDVVESMHKRASHVENALDETIRQALRDKDELYGKIIESKEEILKDKEKQIKEQKDLGRAWEERVHHLEDRLRTMEIKQTLPPEESTPAPGREDKKGEESLEGSVPPVDDLLLSFYTPEKNSIYIPRPARSLFQRRKDREAERFIRQFMEAGDYSEEQKEFLIRCLEQGDSLDFIREYASPKLSVEHMAWLRKIVGRRIRYGR